MDFIGLMFFCFFWIFFIVVGIGGTIFWILMLIDSLKREDKDYNGQNDKIMWLLILIFTHLLGAILYYFLVKKKDQVQVTS